MIKKNNKGITLIALVITIIVLLILASVSVAMLTGNNGILTRASDAKIETALGTVKEQIGLYQIEKKMDNKEVTPENLLAEGKVSRTVQAGDADKYYMYYALKENSFEGMQGLGKGNIASLKDVFLIDDNLNVKYISSNGKEYGDNLNNKVLEDETEIKFSSKAFSKYVSKISGVTEEEMKFKWMKRQTQLEISDASINNLQDLVFFPNLKIIILSGLQLNNLEGIENCTKLETFNKRWGCNIKDYGKLKNLRNLKNIYLNQGKTEDFNNVVESIKELPNLTTMNIDDCPWITDLSPIEKVKKLKSLSIKRINLPDLKGIEELYNLIELVITNAPTLKSIDGIEKLTNLERLTIQSSNVENIEKISNLSNLKELYLDNNNITNITPLSSNTKLTILSLKKNPRIEANRNNYTDDEKRKLDEIGKILDRGGKIYLDADKIRLFNNYTDLDLSNQNLTTLDCLEGLTNLKTLKLNSNNITLEDEKSQNILASMKQLITLEISNNKISNFSCIRNLVNLKKLAANGVNNTFNMKDIETILPNLNHLLVSQATLNTINNCNVEYITNLPIYYSAITELPDLSKFTKLIRIDLRGNIITNIEEIEKCKALMHVLMGDINLHKKTINFENMTNLKNLELNGCGLWSEDLKNLKMPKNNTNLNINLGNNKIIDATSLLELNASTNINLSNNINLSQDSKDKLKAKFGNNVTF